MEDAILRWRTASQLTFFGTVNLAGTTECFPGLGEKSVSHMRCLAEGPARKGTTEERLTCELLDRKITQLLSIFECVGRYSRTHDLRKQNIYLRWNRSCVFQPKSFLAGNLSQKRSWSTFQPETFPRGLRWLSEGDSAGLLNRLGPCYTTAYSLLGTTVNA